MSVIKIILYRALQEAEVGRSVLYLAGPLVCLDLSLASPSFHVPAAEDFISLPLADKLRVVLSILTILADRSFRKVSY